MERQGVMRRARERVGIGKIEFLVEMKKEEQEITNCTPHTPRRRFPCKTRR